MRWRKFNGENITLPIKEAVEDAIKRETAMGTKLKVCIGTDSLSSNHKLCILSELITIKQHYPNIDWGTLLRWATFNGAEFLGIEKKYGSFDIGKQANHFIEQCDKRHTKE